LPEDDADFALRWRLIKSGFSHALPGGERTSASRATRGERGIRQRRYWEHTLRDENGFARHLDYIHFNPVKHGHAARVRDWPYSSFRRWVRLFAYAEIGPATAPTRVAASASGDGFRSRLAHPTC
jgi:putative transposase